MDSLEVSDTHFGLFIAYVLPGLTALYGVPVAFGDAAGWVAPGPGAAPTFAALVVTLVQAVAVGLTVSTVRWLSIDTLHHRTGLTPPGWDFAALGSGVAAYQLLLQIHYRYYKFYSNMVVALAWAYATGGYALGWQGNVGYAALVALFLLGSRDSLKKYYARSGQLLGGRRVGDVGSG